MSNRKHTPTRKPRGRTSKPKTAKHRRHEVAQADVIAQPKDKRLRDAVSAKRATEKLRALALQKLPCDEKRTVGLDIAIREGLTRQHAAHLVNTLIAPARTRPHSVVSVGHIGLSQR